MVTLKTLPQATKQQIFDQVATHLLTQNKKSSKTARNGTLICLYRGPDGTKCAAGCLISDEEYDTEFEEKTWFNLVNYHGVPRNNMTIIKSLQDIHDNKDPSNWKEELKKLAESRQLDSSVLNNF